MIHPVPLNPDGNVSREPNWNENLGRLADVLTWTGDASRTLASLDESFRDALVLRLDVRVRELGSLPPSLRAELREAVRSLDRGTLERGLVEPETCRRIVTRIHPDEEVLEYLEAFFVRGEPIHLSSYEAFRNEPGCPNRIRGIIPVVPLNLDEATFRRAHDRVERALALVHECNPFAGRFVETVMRRLVLGENRELDRFSSNSPQGRVGLARFLNPTHPDVDDVVLAEALVHEAIHGFVGMSETIGLVADVTGRWLVDDTTYDGVSRTVSPWTGTPLDLPTYLHACFVWWGLIFFWANALGRGLFDDRRVRSRIARAAGGFRDRALLRSLRPFESALHPDLLRTLRSMAEEIDPILEESGLSSRVAPAELRP